MGRRETLSRMQLEYALVRADREVDGYFLVYAPCKHLTYEWQGKEVSSAFMGVEKDVTAKCRIHETKPVLCKVFRGKNHYGGHELVVLPECKMAHHII